MKSNADKIYYEIGRILIGIVFIYKAIEYFACIPSLDGEVPSYFRVPTFWVIVLGIVWAAAGISFLFNTARRLMANIVTICIIVILITSTARGFDNVHDTSSTLLKFTGWFCLMGSALMLGSYGTEKYYDPTTRDEIFPRNPSMFAIGRILIGAFFMIAGILHFVNASGDAAYCLPNFPGAKFWVIFTGICWVAAALAYWFNLLTKLATLGVTILVLVITFMINLRGIDAVSAWHDITKLFGNLALIGACFVLASRGHWWFTNFEKKIDSDKQG